MIFLINSYVASQSEYSEGYHIKYGAYYVFISFVGGNVHGDIQRTANSFGIVGDDDNAEIHMRRKKYLHLIINHLK